MAKITQEILDIIKGLFDKQTLIISNWHIYKIIGKRFCITINGRQYEYLKKDIIELISNNSISPRCRNLNENTIAEIKRSFESKEYIIASNDIYRLFESRHQRGYNNFWIVINGITYRTFAHRIIYYIKTGIWDSAKVIHHKDNKKFNNNIENLNLTTQFDNIVFSIRNRELPIIDLKTAELLKSKLRLTDDQYGILRVEILKILEAED